MRRVRIGQELREPYKGLDVVKVKVKFTVEGPLRPRGRVEAQLYSFFSLGARWGGWVVNATPRLP